MVVWAQGKGCVMFIDYPNASPGDRGVLSHPNLLIRVQRLALDTFSRRFELLQGVGAVQELRFGAP